MDWFWFTHLSTVGPMGTHTNHTHTPRPSPYTTIGFPCSTSHDSEHQSPEEWDPSQLLTRHHSQTVGVVGVGSYLLSSKIETKTTIDTGAPRTRTQSHPHTDKHETRDTITHSHRRGRVPYRSDDTRSPCPGEVRGESLGVKGVETLPWYLPLDWTRSPTNTPTLLHHCTVGGIVVVYSRGL